MAAGLALFAFLRSRVAPGIAVAIRQMPDVVAALRTSGRNGSFAVFRFAGAGEPQGDATTVDLQFSLEDGRLGLDWVLLARRNLADKEKIAAFIRGRNHAVNERVMNGVAYLRVEDGDLSDLGVAIATDVYGLTPESQTELIVEGFDWPHSKDRPYRL